MKIIIPIFGMGRAGGERVLCKLATELVRAGNEVIFVIPETDIPFYYSTDAKIVYSKRYNSKIKLLRMILSVYYLWRTCRDLKPDIVLASYHLTAYIASLLLTKEKRFYYVQANEANFYDKFVRKNIAFLSYRLPLNIIVNNRSLLPENIKNIIAVIPAGIDYELFFDEGNPSFDGFINIGIIGREEPYKGTKEIINILSTFIDEHNMHEKIRVNVAVFMPKMEHKIKNIKHFEIHNDVELSAFYKINDIFIATGLIEDGAFHYPCAEAMTAGCLVISNYEPLYETSSELKLKTFSNVDIINLLRKCLSFSEKKIKSERVSNQLVTRELSWSLIGSKMNGVLTFRK
jgi:glycosyltransferase involved in cell wall biosynthesis